jgi:hypothetical protein
MCFEYRRGLDRCTKSLPAWTCSEDSCLSDYDAFQDSLLEGSQLQPYDCLTFFGLSSPDLLADAGAVNGVSANSANQVHMFNVSGVLHDRLHAWASHIPLVKEATGQDQDRGEAQPAQLAGGPQ